MLQSFLKRATSAVFCHRRMSLAKPSKYWFTSPISIQILAKCDTMMMMWTIWWSLVFTVRSLYIPLVDKYGKTNFLRSALRIFTTLPHRSSIFSAPTTKNFSPTTVWWGHVSCFALCVFSNFHLVMDKSTYRYIVTLTKDSDNTKDVMCMPQMSTEGCQAKSRRVDDQQLLSINKIEDASFVRMTQLLSHVDWGSNFFYCRLSTDWLFHVIDTGYEEMTVVNQQ